LRLNVGASNFVKVDNKANCSETLGHSNYKPIRKSSREIYLFDILCNSVCFATVFSLFLTSCTICEATCSMAA